MDYNRFPPSSGGGQSTGNSGQNSNSLMGSIPRRSLPPLAAAPTSERSAPNASSSSQPQQLQQQQQHPSLQAATTAQIPRISSAPSSLSGAIPRRMSNPPPQQPDLPSTQQHQQPATMKISSKSVRPSMQLSRTNTSGNPSPRSPRPPRNHSLPPPVIQNLTDVTITSEDPYIIKIKTAVDVSTGGMHRSRVSSRAPKRKQLVYEELRDTDSEGFLTDSDNNDGAARIKKKRPKVNKSVSPMEFGSTADTEVSDMVMTDTSVVVGFEGDIESPPPGTLSALWYSRECFLHVFVMEKVVGWKTRPVNKLEWLDENAIKLLDPTEATALSQRALTKREFWVDERCRMEVSRINSTQCPVVLDMAAAKEEALSKKTGTPPRFKLAPREDDKREEVLLVKWRGRSHFHCSWERAYDIQKFDPSNNTARNKIRRYYQSQEVALGKDWKRVVEEERATGAAIHSHGTTTDTTEETNVEEYFPPQCLEVERILACDENEMNTQVMAKQRALNYRAEQEAVRRREEAEATDPGDIAKKAPKYVSLVEGLVDIEKDDPPWDPEDNVRYVVKWKSLPYTEMTWEYWRDIKHDAVDEAEDFWYRQRAPDPEELKRLASIPHPHIRDFRKIQTSKAFGNSKRERPIAKLNDGLDPPQEEEDKELNQGFKLRSYQLEGVNWLLFNWWNHRSCILADEMGLGKTIQSLCFIQELQTLPATQVRGPFLIVAPLSLIGQWQSEARSWSPDLNVVLYHGSADARDFLVQQEFYYTEQFVPKAVAVKLRKQHITKFHILITTYEVAMKDIAVLSKVKWRAMLVDEAHRLKSSKSKLFAELKTIPRDYCVLLTGTPLANATEELWALLHFSDPAAFASKDDFLQKFGQLTDANQVSELHTILKPYLLRRVKEDVEKSLPPKEETILEVSLTPVQKTYYKAIYERNTSFLFKGAKPGNAPSLMNVMMELRKACCHPFLIRGVEERILIDAAAQLQGRNEEDRNDVQIDHNKIFAEQLVKSSGKMVLIEKLLPKLFSNGHKVLIFSQMVRVLDLLEELLKIMKYRYERLDGSTSSSSRAAAVDRFNRKSAQRFVMLLSTRAGGLGLNLTAADIVIIFDSDWNPQNDLQAMARAHRIGQTKAVRVYRLLTAKTYEMHMFHSASMKLGLERAVLSQQRDQGDGSDENNGVAKPKSKSEREAQAKEIDELLKKGAYDVFRDEDDTEAQKFMERDIDQLLESSRKVTYGAEAAAGIGSGLGSFSKASFVADTGDGEKDIDLDDENFWEKAVGLTAPVETPEDVAAMIDDGIKRSRKQVQVFDPYASFAEAEQRKKDKIALKIKEEKEEKERARLEKKQKKVDDKERKQKERDELRKSLFEGKATSSEVEEVEYITNKGSKEGKAKKTKKSDRLRAIRRAANEAPVQERLKQAWEVPHRNRVTSAIIRFGFGRFCKLRNESSLTSLPIQDIEIFVRSYVYQLSLQLAVSLMTMLRSAKGAAIDFRPLLAVWMGSSDDEEIDWICQCITSGIKYQMGVENQRLSLRMPYILAEPAYVFELRSGIALRALRRVGILNRLNRIFETVLDVILSELGDEALGKRGCAVKDLSTLDVDLKARHVTSEELILALSAYIQCDGRRAPASWWNRTCDIGLLLGTFIHGLGNYDAMRNDEDLPFLAFIRNFSKHNESFSAAFFRFEAASRAARKVFDDALEIAKIKATKEAHAAVAAAVAAAPKKEQEALALRKGGAEADAVISSMTGETSDDNFDDGDDSHWVTLPRLHQSIIAAAQKLADLTPGSADALSASDVAQESQISDDQDENDHAVTTSNSGTSYRLPMPDARVLDRRLFDIIRGMERNPAFSDDDCPKDDETVIADRKGWSSTDDVKIAFSVKSEAILKVLGTDSLNEQSYENCGIGFSGTQCGALHRSLDDGTDYFVGAASADLAYVAYGNDSPRYLRGVGVPMNLTRYAVSALLNSNPELVETMVVHESERSLTHESGSSSTELGEIRGSSPNPSSVPSEALDDVKSSNQAAPHPQNSMLPRFTASPKLRASICVVALHYSCPYTLNDGDKPTVHPELWQSLIEQTGSLDETPPGYLFGIDKFNHRVLSFAKEEQALDVDEVRNYVESFLLPHCLRLCVLGNGPTRNARGSKGEFETSVGISLYPECTKNLQTPLPDPSLPLGMHSQEAVACASAILRRARLLQASQYIASGNIPVDVLQEIFHSEGLSKAMDGLPIWWCPWIHDLALLIFVATQGISAVFGEREEDVVFSRQAIVQHMYSNFVAEDDVLPRNIVDQSPPEDVTTWIEQQANDFPTPNALERRLALVCAYATAAVDNENRYIDIPMFDHGGWPRN